jgi:aminopeptidase
MSAANLVAQAAQPCLGAPIRRASRGSRLRALPSRRRGRPVADTELGQRTDIKRERLQVSCPPDPVVSLCRAPRQAEGGTHGSPSTWSPPQLPDPHIAGLTPQIMQEGIRPHYRKLDEFSDRLRTRTLRTEPLTVKTERATSFRAHFDPKLDWVKTSGLISPRYWSNLPAGEVFTTPATVDGTFVCDASAGDYFNGKYGDLQGSPLVMKISCARLVQVDCPRKDLEDEFWRYCHTDENSDRVGELAFGTNLGLTRMIGILLQDEKFPGVHLAFGDPYGSQTHANWKSQTHVDVLTRNCDVWIDDDQVIEKGKYQFDHLGLAYL